MKRHFAAALAIAAGVLSAAAAEARDLTATSWGGTFQEIQNDV